MPTTNRRPAPNLPLIGLWVAAVVVAGAGTWMVLSGNAGQADFYNQGGSDPAELLGLQSRATIGGLLIAAGVLGILLALATHARTRAAALTANQSSATPPDATSDVLGDVDDLDEEDGERVPAGADAGVVQAPDDLTDQPTAEPERDAEPARA
ncbi:hypothetical protein J2X63_002653 [Agromyces sp. 3263]|uniref:hypothetical protein n=1 Tax=Agromyces sp. 3263 TaxID=2817750 RepID=UPI0028571E2C|nr:hypothetical protein [Agromyces sp. 3263]MDR6906945.1 hypothetical protein [Agromyces sp. 3263]